MEQLRARPALDRLPVNGRCVLVALPALWLTPVMAWGHAGAFILAKCSTDSAGTVSLELTVDCLQHPALTEKSEALAALRGVLTLHSPSGPVALGTLATALPETSSTPDPDIPVSIDPPEAGRSHELVKLRYSWQPGVPEIRFSVPVGNPHDVLFWLAGKARPATGPVPWQILIAGDTSPPVPVPVPQPSPHLSTAARWALAISIGLLLAETVRRHRAAAVRDLDGNSGS